MHFGSGGCSKPVKTLNDSANPLFYDSYGVPLSSTHWEDFCVSTNCQFDLGCGHRFVGRGLLDAFGDAVAEAAFSKPDWPLCFRRDGLAGDASTAHSAGDWTIGHIQPGSGLVDEIEPCSGHVGIGRLPSSLFRGADRQSFWCAALVGLWLERHYFALCHFVLGATQQWQHDALVAHCRALVGTDSKCDSPAGWH